MADGKDQSAVVDDAVWIEGKRGGIGRFISSVCERRKTST
jgi:hypothetical protein